MGRLVFFLEPLDTPHHGQSWSLWGRERCSGMRQGLLTVRLWLTTSPALGSTGSTRWVCTRAPTCPLVTTLSPSLWCYLPTFPLRIFTFRVLLNNRETSTQLPWQLVSDTRGNRSHSHLLLSGRPSPSTASSSKVLRVVTSDFQNFHLTANKVCDWFVDVLIDDTVI